MKTSKTHLKNKYPKKLPSNESFFIAKIQKGECTENNCNGNCSDKSTCICLEGYANYPYQNSNKYCTYKQKTQIKAFFLELFLPFGIGHLYARRIFYGLIKMMVITSPATVCAFTFFGILISDKFLSGGNTSIIIGIFVSFLCLVGIAFYLIDIINFAKNRYYDGNDIPLKDW